MKIGVLCPRSKAHPDMMADFVDGIKSALKHYQFNNEVQLITESIGFGGNEKEVFEKAEKILFEMDLKAPTALILGSEEDGISDDLLRRADALARIPIRGKISSLNVSVAAGVAIYEVVRQQLQKK